MLSIGDEMSNGSYHEKNRRSIKNFFQGQNKNQEDDYIEM